MALDEHAQWWLARGGMLLPLQPNKQPFFEGWGDRVRPGVERQPPSNDQETVDAWALRYPGCGWGLFCRLVDGTRLVVVDVDVKGGAGGAESLARLVEKYGPLPNTLINRTPSGGWHYIYTMPKPGLNNWLKGSLLGAGYPGIDIQAGGSSCYVVLPPMQASYTHSTRAQTEHHQGQYTSEALRDLAEAPEWVGLVLEASSRRGQSIRSATVDRPEGVVTLARNNDLVSMLGTMRRKGWDEKSLLSLAHATNNDVFDSPLSAREIERLVASVADYPVDPLEGTNPGDTDHNNADLFIRVCNGNLRWSVSDNVWWSYVDGRWVPDAGMLGKFTNATAQRVRSAAIGLSGDDGKRMFARFLNLESFMGRKQMWGVARDDADLQISSAELDTDPMLFNVQNGTLDLREPGSLIAHNPMHRLSKMAGCEYDPRVDQTEWKALIDRALRGNRSVIDWLQRVMGYGLSGLTNEELALFVTGPAGSGKSTFFETIQAALGDYFTVGATALFIGSDRGSNNYYNALASIRGARLVVIPEAPGGQPLIADQFKSLISGDTMTARVMRGNFYDYQPSALVCMHSNYQLSIRESDDAVGRRLRHVKFDAPLRADQMDRQLKDRFKQEQRQAALAWMVDGWRMYRERGLQAPEDVMVWSRQYLDEGNNVHRFVAEQCYLAADGRVTKSDLYAEYAAWCRRNGEMPFGNKNFTQLMRQRHPQLAEQNVRPTGGYPERGWAGIGLANDRTDPNRPAETF